MRCAKNYKQMSVQDENTKPIPFHQQAVVALRSTRRKTGGMEVTGNSESEMAITLVSGSYRLTEADTRAWPVSF